jgi:hypothetical protein
MDENYYILYSIDEFDCVSAIIDKERRLAEIHGIGNYKLDKDNYYIKN